MRTSDWLLLVLLSVLWGATFFIAVANPEVPPLTPVLRRVGVASGLVVIDGRLLAWLGRRKGQTLRVCPHSDRCGT